MMMTMVITTQLIMLVSVKPYIKGEGLQSMIIKKGQVISYDIKYGGEPEPEVKWILGEEVTNHFISFIFTYFSIT